MKFPRLAFLPMLAIGAACGGSGSSDPGAVPQQALYDDSALLSKVYDTGYSVPAGFFVDERAATTRSYTVHHVLDASGSPQRR